MEKARNKKRNSIIAKILFILILLTLWGQYSPTYKKWFLKHELGAFPSSIKIHKVYGSTWEMDYWYIFELRHPKEATREIVKREFIMGGDPDPEFVRHMIEQRTGRLLDQALQWKLYTRKTRDVRMYYLVPSIRAKPEASITSYLYVYTL